jgi:hypothetical protein
MFASALQANRAEYRRITSTAAAQLDKLVNEVAPNGQKNGEAIVKIMRQVEEGFARNKDNLVQIMKNQKTKAEAKVEGGRKGKVTEAQAKANAKADLPASDTTVIDGKVRFAKRDLEAAVSVRLLMPSTGSAPVSKQTVMVKASDVFSLKVNPSRPTEGSISMGTEVIGSFRVTDKGRLEVTVPGIATGTPGDLTAVLNNTNFQKANIDRLSVVARAKGSVAPPETKPGKVVDAEISGHNEEVKAKAEITTGRSYTEATTLGELRAQMPAGQTLALKTGAGVVIPIKKTDVFSDGMTLGEALVRKVKKIDEVEIGFEPPGRTRKDGSVTTSMSMTDRARLFRRLGAETTAEGAEIAVAGVSVRA